MQDLVTRLSTLKRPRLMIKSARKGQDFYNRSKCLPRILGASRPPGIAAGLARLLDLEHEMNHKRKLQDPGYSFARHIELLIALLSEARLYLTSHHAKTGGSPLREPPAQSGKAQRDAVLT